MEKKEEHPKEINKISQILGYAEEHEEEEEKEEETGKDVKTESGEEDDSSHYSVGGDNGL
jgi:hypothetical protein